MIKAVIFDCFGVLTADTWQEFLDSLQPEADKEAARNAHRQFDAGLISKEECGQKILAATGKKFVELEDSSANNYSKNVQLLKYVGELRKRGFKTGILSNVSSNWIREEFLSGEEQGLFDDFLLSYEVGLIKPNPKMFMLAAERLNIKPGQAVVVDDKSRYCDAAKNLGFKTVTYQTFEQMRGDLEEILKRAES